MARSSETHSLVSNYEFAIMAYGSGDIVKNNYMSTLGPKGIGVILNPNAGDTVTGNTVNESRYGLTGVTGNTVSGNTYYNVMTLTQP